MFILDVFFSRVQSLTDGKTFFRTKREDLAGMELGGNKVRKLEFIMADAVAQGADCVITTGFIQSSHCVATAVAAKYLNLDSYFIMITSKVLVDQDPGLTGNLLVKCMIGAHIELVTKEEFFEFGNETLTNILKEKLISEGRRPYAIPVGGSNSLGTWGYIEAIREIEQQIQSGPNNIKFHDIVVPCSSSSSSSFHCRRLYAFAVTAKAPRAISVPSPLSSSSPLEVAVKLVVATSRGKKKIAGAGVVRWRRKEIVNSDFGGTAAGLSLGSSLSSLKARVHAFSVFEDTDFYFDFIQGLLDGLEAGVDSRDIVEIHNADGLGYAINTSEELNLLKEIAVATGIILHPSYSGKAVYRMLRDMSENPKKWEGRKILFIHTGGLLGLYEKMDELASLVGNCHRMDVHDSVPPHDSI